MRFNKIDAVLKVTERCNINCTYCYMFNKESELYRKKPKQMKLDVAEVVANHLVQGAQDVGAETLRIIFHGGEPTMMGVATFDKLCQIFVASAADKVDLQFTIQTNAMLLDDAWIRLFERYRISIGVSLDGERDVNDIHRIDHAGRGTYDRTAEGVRLLSEAHRQGKIPAPGVLCVIDPAQDGRRTFNHFAKDLGFQWIDFLLPIDTHETASNAIGAGVGRYLASVFDAWNELGDKKVSIRFFDLFYSFMTGYERKAGKPIPYSEGTLILTISTDGTFGPDDTLRIVSDDYYSFDCRTDSLTSYLADPRIRALSAANQKLPNACADCAWGAYCVGGATNGRLVNRYSRIGEFENKSVVCDGLMQIYSTLAKSLIAAGYPGDAMFERLERAAIRLETRRDREQETALSGR